MVYLWQQYGLRHSGVHRIFIHPVVTAVAWWRLYGFPRDVRLWAAFILIDVGYISRFHRGPGAEAHVELGARIIGKLFGAEWGEFCRRHSRHYARPAALRISRLCGQAGIRVDAGLAVLAAGPCKRRALGIH
jgi:hypothetical protein